MGRCPARAVLVLQARAGRAALEREASAHVRRGGHDGELRRQRQDDGNEDDEIGDEVKMRREDRLASAMHIPGPERALEASRARPARAPAGVRSGAPSREGGRPACPPPLSARLMARQAGVCRCSPHGPACWPGSARRDLRQRAGAQLLGAGADRAGVAA